MQGLGQQWNVVKGLAPFHDQLQQTTDSAHAHMGESLGEGRDGAAGYGAPGFAFLHHPGHFEFGIGHHRIDVVDQGLEAGIAAVMGPGQVDLQFAANSAWL